jgi:hypothetical protein
MQLSGSILSVSSKTLSDVRDSILTYHIMVEYCSYFTLWGLGICATYLKEVQGSVLYITLILIFVMEEEVWFLDINIWLEHSASVVTVFTGQWKMESVYS